MTLPTKFPRFLAGVVVGAPKTRGVRALGLALLVGFLAYRVALAAIPSDVTWATPNSRDAPNGREAPQFDALTGWLIVPDSGVYANYVEPLVYWWSSALMGLGVAVLAFVVVFVWLGRRRRDKPVQWVRTGPGPPGGSVP
jgi:hypothetical protein